jgi:hypothetical protein
MAPVAAGAVAACLALCAATAAASLSAEPGAVTFAGPARNGSARLWPSTEEHAQAPLDGGPQDGEMEQDGSLTAYPASEEAEGLLGGLPDERRMLGMSTGGGCQACRLHAEPFDKPACR